MSAPDFLDLLMQANKAYLLQFNISEEIANYLHCELYRANANTDDLISKLPMILEYNLDKERLEEALRKKLIIRILDFTRFDVAKEKALSEALRSYFGGKFNHRLELLINNRDEDQ